MIVTDLIRDSGGVSCPDGTQVLVTLAGSNGAGVEGYDSSGTLVAPHSYTTSSGVLTMTLVSNGSIIPAGTVYRLTHRLNGQQTVRYITVPNTGSTWAVKDILTTAPGSVPPPGADPYGAAAAVQANLNTEATTRATADTTLTTNLATETTNRATADATLTANLAGQTDRTGAVLANTQRLMAKLTRNLENATMLIIGDSTGVTTARWVYLMSVALAPLYPAYTVNYYTWDDTNSVYTSATVLQTGSGGNVLNIYNASVSGKGCSYPLAPNFEPMVAVIQPDLIFISHGHNEQNTTTNNWRGQYSALTESVSEACPTAGIVCVGQNPETANNYQGLRASVYADIAAARGYGFLDVHQLFMDNGGPTVLDVDGVHPNTAGTTLWVNLTMAALVYHPNTPARTQMPSSLSWAGEQLLANGDFSQFTASLPSSWVTGGAGVLTASKDTTNYESVNGYSVRLQNTGSGAQIQQDLPLHRVRGKWVTFAVRIRVPAGSATTVGRIAIVDSTGSIVSLSNAPDGLNDFKWIVLTRRIPATATFARVYVYPDSTVTGGDVSVDRVTCTLGMLPKQAASGQPGPAGATGSASTGQIDYLSTVGSNPIIPWLANSQIAHSNANSGIVCQIRPFRDTVVSRLRWFTGATASGNYDIGIYDSTGTKLWSKGSAAWPAINTAQSETVSPTVTLTAGSYYYIVLAADNTSGLWRGTQQAVADQTRLLDNTFYTRFVATIFPLPASITLGATVSTKIPVITVHEA